MPFVVKNISDAFARGRPFVLHKLDGRPKQDAKRAQACAPFDPGYGGSCDEYSLALSMEGGAGAHIMEVPLREQFCQGGTLARQYQREGITQGLNSVSFSSRQARWLRGRTEVSALPGTGGRADD